jgi:hypothetical protein
MEKHEWNPFSGIRRKDSDPPVTKAYAEGNLASSGQSEYGYHGMGPYNMYPPAPRVHESPSEAPRTSGWACPVCGKGNAPFVAQCPCEGREKASEAHDTPTSSKRKVADDYK